MQLTKRAPPSVLPSQPYSILTEFKETDTDSDGFITTDEIKKQASLEEPDDTPSDQELQVRTTLSRRGKGDHVLAAPTSWPLFLPQARTCAPVVFRVNALLSLPAPSMHLLSSPPHPWFYGAFRRSSLAAVAPPVAAVA